MVPQKRKGAAPAAPNFHPNKVSNLLKILLPRLNPIRHSLQLSQRHLVLLRDLLQLAVVRSIHGLLAIDVQVARMRVVHFDVGNVWAGIVAHEVVEAGTCLDVLGVAVGVQDGVLADAGLDDELTERVDNAAAADGPSEVHVLAVDEVLVLRREGLLAEKAEDADDEAVGLEGVLFDGVDSIAALAEFRGVGIKGGLGAGIGPEARIVGDMDFLTHHHLGARYRDGVVLGADQGAEAADLGLVDVEVATVAVAPVDALYVGRFRLAMPAQDSAVVAEDNLGVVERTDAHGIVELVDAHDAVDMVLLAGGADAVSVIARNDDGVVLQAEVPLLQLLNVAGEAAVVVGCEARNVGLGEGDEVGTVLGCLLDLLHGNVNGFLLVEYDLRCLHCGNPHFLSSAKDALVRFLFRNGRLE